MAHDIFVYFEKGKLPTRQEIEYVLTDYFQGLSKGPPVWKEDRFFLYLPGNCGHPLKRVLPENMAWAWKALEEEPWPRWIEVWLSKDGPEEEDDPCINVMTRHSDEVTNTLASGFAEVVARWWKGRMETG